MKSGYLHEDLRTFKLFLFTVRNVLGKSSIENQNTNLPSVASFENRALCGRGRKIV